jgi:hypothetical protein
MVFVPQRTYILSKVPKVRMSLPLLFLIFTFWTTGALGAVSLGTTIEGRVYRSASRGLPPKTQVGGSTSVDLRVPVLGWLGLATAVEVLGVLPSDVSGGFLYRGYDGAALWMSLEAWRTIPLRDGLGTLEAGGALGAGVWIVGYGNTTLNFSYPEAQATGFLLYAPAACPMLGIRFSLPMRAQFRRDLEYALSVGVGVGISIRWEGTR